VSLYERVVSGEMRHPQKYHKKIFHDLLSQLFVFCQINLDNVVHITIF